MNDSEYDYLHELPKQLIDEDLDDMSFAQLGEQKKFNGHGIFVSNEKFTVIQVRKGKRRKTDLTYILMYNKTNSMVRVDIVGAAHHGVPTPHIHIFDDKHNQGDDVIAIADLDNYDPTDDIVSSFMEFLKYNNFRNVSVQTKLFNNQC
ncbi:MAG: hypothetical protein IAA89_06835 [Firmicutes bacterium]|uniref:Uncharacterized protein n=1 Tax=Candidatus Gallilactobacillus intestinavium TaxID=2840838 RepID=A0A9D9E655_9LACO|nr:hypothetical protein [Candidatus Gallilactobacillus intestinavium]